VKLTKQVQQNRHCCFCLFRGGKTADSLCSAKVSATYGQFIQCLPKKQKTRRTI